MAIIKLHDDKENKDYYLIWSGVVDAPVTYGMTLDELKAYYKEEYGNNGMLSLNDKLKRVEETGTSDYVHQSIEDYFTFNRAGKNDRQLNKEQIIEMYCRNPKKV